MTGVFVLIVLYVMLIMAVLYGEWSESENETTCPAVLAGEGHLWEIHVDGYEFCTECLARKDW